MPLESLLPILLELMAKSAAVLLLAAGLALVFRHRSAANRHIIWLSAFGALGLLPFTKLARPLWSYEWARKPAAPEMAVPFPVVAREVMPASAIEKGPVEIVASQPSSAPRLHWPAAAVGLWFGGMVLLLAHRLAVEWQMKRLVRTSQPMVDDRVLRTWRVLATATSSQARLRVSDQCRVPMVVGVLRPSVLLPVQALEWTDARLAAVLQHELGHIRRGDCLARLVADGLCAVYWMNPLVWFAARHMRVAQEQACDDLVLGWGADPVDYASQLVDIVRSLGKDRVSSRHALAMAQPSTLETRVRSIVDGSRDRRSLSPAMAVGGAASVLAAVALCGMAQIAGAAEQGGPTKNMPPTSGLPADETRQVYITSKFIEISQEAVPPALLDGEPEADASQPPLTVYSDPQFQLIIRALTQKKGVDLMSAPSLTTKSNQGATVEVVREFPLDGFTDSTTFGHWEKDAITGAWKSTLPFKRRQVGITLGVMPSVQDDGLIRLALTPEVVEFAGFFDLDGAGKLVRWSQEPTKTGHVPAPIFIVRKLDTTVSLQSGQTVAMHFGPPRYETADGEAMELDPPGTDQPSRQLLAFVSAASLKPMTETKAKTTSSPFDDWEIRGLTRRQGQPEALLHNKKTEEFRTIKTIEDKDGFKLLKVDLDKNSRGTVEVFKTGVPGTGIFTLPAASVAAKPSAVIHPASDDELVTFNFVRQPLGKILDLYERLSGKRVIRDSKMDAVQFTLKGSGAMKKDKALRFIEESLQLNDYSLVSEDETTMRLARQAATFTISGHVKTQGKYEIPAAGIHLAEAIEMAGGLKSGANPRQVKITHKGSAGGPTVMINMASNPLVQPSDIINIRAMDDDLSDQYFAVYMMFREGEKEALLGDLQKVLDKYQQAQVTLNQLAQSSPEWQSSLVKYRRAKIADSIAALKLKMAASPSPSK